ncbi:MAG: zinc ribbon domain-containing protein [Desulfohalobiaceae bacterium]|nr:zinc ribbon domain-containing protein [Desulfohalobiaceae bacterium]
MILYEFICRKCNNIFEELVKSESEDIACPQCGSHEVERVLSAVKGRSDASAGGSRAGSGCAPSSGFS